MIQGNNILVVEETKMYSAVDIDKYAKAEGKRYSYLLFTSLWKQMFPIDYNNRFVNIGSGNWLGVGWETIDLEPHNNITFHMNLNKEYILPFADNTVKVFFISHLLYYLFPEKVDYLLEECYRCMKKNSLIRLVVIDFNKAPERYKKTSDEIGDINKYVSYRILTKLSYKQLESKMKKIGYIDIHETIREESAFPALVDPSINFDRVDERDGVSRNEWSIFIEAKKQ